MSNVPVRQYRYTVLLPIIAAVTTFGLWLSARAQYLRFVCPPAGRCPANGWPLGWTDYTPPAIQTAGMLNVPVAFFAQPLYRLVQADVRKWEFVALLVGAIATWAYIGWRLDTRASAYRTKAVSRVVGVLGCILALFILVQTMAIFHVGLLYKIVAVSWSLLMFRHFVRILRIAPDVQANHNLHNRRSVPRLALANIVTIWAVFLVVGGVVLSPRDPSGAPDPMLAHVFAGCGGLLLLATAYGVVAHLVTEWRNMSAAINRQFYLISAVMDTCLAFAALAAISFVVVRG